MRKPYRKTPTWRTLCFTMNKIALAVLIVSVAAASSIATLAAQKHVQKSTVYAWDAGTKANDWGGVRQVMRSPTPTLDELEIHISTLEPGKSPHAPHQHQHEELLIIKDGTLETFQSGARRKVGPGGIIFQASNELHNVTNVGWFPATYYVIGWTVPGALTK
ncbi:MAG: cupin domain-containing protein [Acidobacteria bacterium]|nr:MAG: cupin domain-containing protein [Acidobacteriota bacterium]